MGSIVYTSGILASQGLQSNNSKNNYSTLANEAEDKRKTANEGSSR